jgi:hypothetical protein
MTQYTLFCELSKRHHAQFVGGWRQHRCTRWHAVTLSPAQRALVLANKPDLVAFLLDTRKTIQQLLAAAMRACAYHYDVEPALAKMRQDCMDTPPHLRNDLLQHFNETYLQKTLIESRTPRQTGPILRLNQ